MVEPEDRQPMDEPEDESLQAGTKGEQEAADSPRIVRRIEITVEREITTVIVRRRKDLSEPNPSSDSPAYPTSPLRGSPDRWSSIFLFEGTDFEGTDIRSPPRPTALKGTGFSPYLLVP